MDELKLDPLEEVKALVRRMMDQSYLDGYRRATKVIAMSIGQLDGESKTKLSKTIDILETEIERAETALK